MKKILLLVSLIFTLNIFSQIPNYVPSNGLVAWYPFNGNANDESGNNHNGTVFGATLATDRFGSANSAYHFNGDTSSIFIADTLFNIGWNGFTISLWFNSDTLITPYNPNQCMINTRPHNGISIGFNFNSDNKYHFWAGSYPPSSGWDILGNDSVSNSSVSVKIWKHMVLVKNSTTYYVYLNGSLDKIFYSSVAASNYYCQISMGRISDNLPNHEVFDGRLDDYAIWNRSLSLNEILQVYQGCQVSISTQPTNQIANAGTDAIFTIASPIQNTTYQWQTDLGLGFQNISNAGQYSGTTNDTLVISNTTLSNNNQLLRCIVISGSCSDTSDVGILTVINNVGINESADNSLFKFYPNPATDKIYVQLHPSLIGAAYTIIDPLGKTVLSGKLNSENAIIELSNLSGGIYFFCIAEYAKQPFEVMKK